MDSAVYELYAPIKHRDIIAEVYEHPEYATLSVKYREHFEQNGDGLSTTMQKQLNKYRLKLWCHLYLGDPLPTI
jgi:hypothetical protein